MFFKKYINIQPVEAIRYNENNFEDVSEFINGCNGKSLTINTIDGTRKIEIGDWVIKNGLNNYDVCSNFFFINSYIQESDMLEKPKFKGEHYTGRVPKYF